MKRISKHPYIQNIVRAWHSMHPDDLNSIKSYMDGSYRKWLSTHGFKTPVTGDYLEFSDNFSDEELLHFIIKWS